MSNPGEYLDNYLHTVYDDPGKIEDMATRGHIFMMKLPREAAQGKISGYPYKLNPSMGLAANRVDSNTTADQSGGKGKSLVGEWLCRNGDYKGTVNINDKDIDEGSASNSASYIRALDFEIEGLIDSFGERVETYLARSTKSLGSVAVAGIHDTNGVITLATYEDVYNFHIGMILVCSSGDGSLGTEDLLNGVGYVVGVDLDAGTVTVGATPGGACASPTAWETQNDSTVVYLFNYGDFQGDNAADTGSQVGTFILDSILDWITSSSSPTPTTFHSVDRSKDSRLTGTRLPSALITGSIENRMLNLATGIFNVGGNKGPLTFFANTFQWTKLVGLLKSRGITPEEKTAQGKTTSFGYSAIFIDTPMGRCEVLPSPHLAQTVCLALNLKYWKLAAIGNKIPAVMNTDGLKMLRKADNDDYQFRLKCYLHSVTPSPAFSGRVPLASLT